VVCISVSAPKAAIHIDIVRRDSHVHHLHPLAVVPVRGFVKHRLSAVDNTVSPSDRAPAALLFRITVILLLYDPGVLEAPERFSGPRGPASAYMFHV